MNITALFFPSFIYASIDSCVKKDQHSKFIILTKTKFAIKSSVLHEQQSTFAFDIRHSLAAEYWTFSYNIWHSLATFDIRLQHSKFNLHTIVNICLQCSSFDHDIRHSLATFDICLRQSTFPCNIRHWLATFADDIRILLATYDI